MESSGRERDEEVGRGDAILIARIGYDFWVFFLFGLSEYCGDVFFYVSIHTACGVLE